MNELERSVLGTLNTEEPTALIHQFSKLVRMSGSKEEREAVDYVLGRLRAFGIPHRLHEPICFISLPIKAELKVTAPYTLEIRAKTPAMSVSTGDTPVVGELVYIPSAQAKNIADIFGSDLGEGVDLRGKILLTEGFPMPGKLRSARQAGAVGAIFIAPGERIHEGICTDIWGAPDLDSYQRQPDLPVLGINRPDGMKLAESAKAGKVTVELKTWLDTGWRPIPVIEAEIEGTERPDEFVLYHGHIDSWHAGIGDNATGNASLLEVARTFWQHRQQLKRTLKVVWWSGHSHGRYAGSTWYADQFGLDLAEHCVLHVNCDSPGCRWATDYNDAMFMSEAIPLGRGAVADAVGQEAKGQRPLRAGDCSFNNIGVATCFMEVSWMPKALLQEKGYYPVGGNGGNIEWHAEDDELHLYDPEILLRDLKVYSLALLRGLNSTIHPLDYRETVAELKAIITNYQAAATGRFDLTPALTEAEVLAAELESFYGRLDVANADRANATIRALGRILIPVLYTRDGAFRQDPAVEPPALPDLAPALSLPSLPAGSHAEHVTRTHLVRGLNRVIWALRQARRVAAAV